MLVLELWLGIDSKNRSTKSVLGNAARYRFLEPWLAIGPWNRGSLSVPKKMARCGFNILITLPMTTGSSRAGTDQQHYSGVLGSGCHTDALILTLSFLLSSQMAVEVVCWMSYR